MNKIYVIFISLLIALGTLFQSLTMFRSGQTYSFGIGYWGPTARDGVWHQALIEQLKRKVPPENPGLAGVELSNYHYYYDYLLATTGKIFPISSSDLVYRVAPIIFSVLFGIGTMLLSNKIFKNKLASIMCVFFAYFGSSFGWVVEFIRERHFGGESAFWMNQPVSMNLNPPFAISMVIVIYIILFLIDYKKSRSWVNTGVLILLIGLLSEFKIYAGVVMFAPLGIVSFYELLRHKKSDLFFVLIPSLLIFLLLIAVKKSETVGLIIIKPFWFINSMIDSPDRVGWIKLTQAREAYLASGRLLKYILSQVLSLGIFIFGNYGTRLVGLMLLVFNFKKIPARREYYLLLTTFLVSFSIPLIIIQKGNPWNTIQFSYYSLYILALFAGGAVAYILTKFKNIILEVLIGALLIVTPISSYTTFTFAYTNTPPAKLGRGENEILTLMRNLDYGVVLTPSYNKNLRSFYYPPFPLVVYDTTTYVAAFSGMPVYIEDENQQEILGNNYKERVDSANEFFIGKDKVFAKKLLMENNISYIYLPKVFNYSLGGYKDFLELIAENDEAIVYKTLK